MTSHERRSRGVQITDQHDIEGLALNPVLAGCTAGQLLQKQPQLRLVFNMERRRLGDHCIYLRDMVLGEGSLRNRNQQCQVTGRAATQEIHGDELGFLVFVSEDEPRNRRVRTDGIAEIQTLDVLDEALLIVIGHRSMECEGYLSRGKILRIQAGSQKIDQAIRFVLDLQPHRLNLLL